MDKTSDKKISKNQLCSMHRVTNEAMKYILFEINNICEFVFYCINCNIFLNEQRNWPSPFLRFCHGQMPI